MRLDYALVGYMYEPYIAMVPGEAGEAAMFPSLDELILSGVVGRSGPPKLR